MKIYNIQTNKNINYQQQTSFKAAKISPITLKKLGEVKNNPKSNELLIKLAGLLGLTTILSWVKSLSKNNNNDNLKNLDIIDTAWTNRNNALLLQENSKDKYLEILSKTDETESILWTKALVSEDSTEENIEYPILSEEVSKLFLSKESNETFMTVSANKAINTILMQINALNNTNEEIREKYIKDITNKLNRLIKEAEKLQDNPTNSELYSKLANITKIFTLYNIFNNDNIDKDKNEETIQNEKITEPTNIAPAKDHSDSNALTNLIDNNTVLETTEIPSSETEKIELSENLKPALNIVGKIELKEDGVTRFRSTDSNKTSIEVKEPLGKIIITEKNKHFIEEAFLKAFKKTSPVVPETYSAHIDYIKMIYDSYSDEKDLLKKNLLIRMSEKDLRKSIDKYFKFTDGKMAKFDFLNFIKLEEFKLANGGEITKKDFDFINNARDDILRYFTLINDRAEIAFNLGIDAEKRLQFIKEFHKIAYNIDSNKLFHGTNLEKVTTNNILCELSYKLAQDSYQYPNIIRYLGIDIDELPETTNNENTDVNIDEKINDDLEDTVEYINRILCNTKYRMRLKELTEILNNDSFDGIMNSTHSKMRFIERFVFHDPRLLSKKTLEIKQKTTQKLDRLKKSIECIERIKFINYPAKDSTKKSQRFGPRIFIKDYTIGLNDKGEIHTIWDE